MITICPSCRGQGHVEGNPCSCLGWGRLKVSVLGPCDSRGVVQTTSLEDVVKSPVDLAIILADRAMKGTGS